jgi:hypothetical protein
VKPFHLQNELFIMEVKMLECTQLETQCRNILNADEHIESVAFLNKKGKPVEITSRTSMFFQDLTEQQKEMLFMECILQHSMNTEYDNELGKTKYSIIEREDVLLFSFPIREFVVMVISKLPVNPFVLKNKILQSCV